MTALTPHTSPTQGAPVWAELRAEKAPGPGYFWHIEGRDSPRSDPTDPESWSWVADVDGTEHIYNREPGETARLLALRWNAHGPMVEALEYVLARVQLHPRTEAMVRASLKLARGEGER